MAEPNRQMRTEKVQLMLEDGELTAIDDWRFTQHMPSRASAVRELLRRGLHAAHHAVVEVKRTKSTDFRVLDDSRSSLNRMEGSRNPGSRKF